MTAPTAAPPIRSPWRRALRLVGLAVGTYLGIVLLMVLFENHLVYPGMTAARDWSPPVSPDIRDVTLTSADGTKIHGWYLPCPGSADALLYFHGNGGNLSHRGPLLLELRQTLNVSVLVIDYPGYGKSEGSPTEQGCYRAADAAYDWLVENRKIEPRRIVLFGKSLGGGVATYLASTREHRALVLLKTYTSLPDVAARLYPWLPVRWLMRNRFDSLSRLAHCHRPIFIAHGTEDRLIPFVHAQRLYAAASEPKELFPFPGDHDTALPAALFARLREFLQAHPLAPPLAE